jgi:4-amino-4-deoxy-L-arabinose transferase-like glycosyltransferase
MTRLLPNGLRNLLGLGDQAPGPYPPGIQPGPGNLPSVPPGGNLPYPRPYQPSGNLPYLPPGNMPQLPGGGQGVYNQPNPQPGSGDGMFTQETGERGLLRLFNQQLVGQVSWLLPLAFLGGLAILWRRPAGRRFDLRRQAAFLWLAWLLPQMAFFSYANLFHRYYLCMMAPGVAALVGAGLDMMFEDYRARGWKGWLLPLALAATAILQVVFLAYFPEWGIWMTPLILCLTGAAVLFLLLLRLTPGTPHSLAQAAATLGLIALLIAPFAWSLTPILYGGDVGLPYAGPELEKSRRPGGDALENRKDDRLLQYLLENFSGETYLLATVRAGEAAPFILSTGEPVMAMGGFSGSDPILTVDELTAMIQDGEVRFFLLTGDNAQGGLLQFIRLQCSQVPSDQLGLPTGPGQPGGQAVPKVPQVFDCGNLKP